MTFSVSSTDFFVNAPFLQLDDGLLDLFLEYGLQPEIGLEGDAVYAKNITDFAGVAAQLKKNRLSCTLHAPFLDLAVGSSNPLIRQTSREKLRRAFELVAVFQPKVIVCHLGFEAGTLGDSQAEWFAQAKITWAELLPIAAKHKAIVVFENTYESNPQQHIRMLNELNSPYAGFCLDTGHVTAFAKNSWQDWLPVFDSLRHLHLHDNRGDADEHLAVGAGTFDFNGFFNCLAERQVKPTVTIEPHTRDDLWSSLDSLREMGVLKQ
jgi:sugar phosphate isomerase/epimerase